jgi:transcriptional regulator with XRE-family HTH domain
LVIETPAHELGGKLREWRARRRMSQLDLACSAEISTKDLSFLETGRTRPSRQVLLNLAACLRMPLRDQNDLLLAAAFAPTLPENAFEAPMLDGVRRTVESVLASYEPNPAMVIDRHWTMLTANRAVAHLVAGAEPMLLRPPGNLLRLFMHPAGLASRIVNLAQWHAHVIGRLRQQVDYSGDPALTDLIEEICDYLGPNGTRQPDAGAAEFAAVPLRLATFDGVLSFFTMTARFTAPADITVAELSIEAFLPADAGTAAVMRRVAAADESLTVAQAELV